MARNVEEIANQFTGNTSIRNFDELIHFRSLRRICADAFRGCTSLQTIVLPEGLTSVGENAFYGCKSLQTVTAMMKEPFAISDNTFGSSPEGYIYRNAQLRVPVGTRSKYAAAPGWRNFQDIVEVVHFADKEVERLCLENFDADKDGLLSGDEARAVTSLGSIFKGNKLILVNQGLVRNNMFNRIFRKIYEK